MAETVAKEKTVPDKKRSVQALRRKQGRKRAIKRAVAFLVAAAVLIGGGYYLYGFLKGGKEALGDIYSEYAALGNIQSKVSGSGVARARESASITLTQSGVVQDVFVSSGQQVTEGQPLYTVFSQAAQDEVTKAQEQIDKLNDELAALQEAEAELTVCAPYSGKLMNVKQFSIDQQVEKDTVIAELVNDKQLKLTLYYSYAYENDIFTGQSVVVSVPAVMNTFEGKVEKINMVSYISSEGAVCFEVTVVFDNPGTLTSGMAASALMKTSDGTDIYPYTDGKLEFYEIRPVTVHASGPVTAVGTLLDHANVTAGQELLYLGTDTVDAQIAAKQAEITAAQQSLEQKEAALQDFSAPAPISGTVISCTLNQGAEVKAGDTVIVISNNTNMVVTINVDDRNISFLSPGSNVELDWNGMPYMGTVTAIDMGGAQSGSGMTNYPVTLSVDNYDGSLMDGAWLRYSFVTSQSDECVLIPSSSVQYFSDKDGNRQAVVFVKRESRPSDVPELEYPVLDEWQKRRWPLESEGYYPVIVETGISDTKNVEIISGIAQGDEVFVNFTITDNAW